MINNTYKTEQFTGGDTRLSSSHSNEVAPRIIKSEVKMEDYNGIEIPSKVKAENIVITVAIKYEGKYGQEEHQIQNCTLEEWCGMDDTLRTLEIEY